MEPKVPLSRWKKFRIGLEVVSGILLFLFFLAGMFFWRVSTTPLDMAFAKPYIEAALSSPESGISVALDGLVLHWPDLGGPLLLDVRGVKIFGQDKTPIVAIAEASVSLSKAGLLIGRVLPVGLILQHPEVTLIRTKEGAINVSLGGVSDSASANVPGQTALTENILQHVARPGREKDSPLASLKTFEIVDAQVNIEDLKTGTSSYLPFADVLFQSTREGLNADMNIALNDAPDFPSYFRASMVIPWEEKDVVLDASLENFDVALLADKIPALSILDGQDIEIDGKVYAVLDKNFRPQQVHVKANSAGGAFNIPEWSPDAVSYSGFSLDLDYDGEAENISLKNTQITVKDVTVEAEADLNVSAAGMSGPLKLSIKELKQAQIKPLWPKALEGDNAEEWIVKNMSEGTFYDVSATIDLFALSGADGWDYGAKDIRAAFSFENMAVDYRSPLWPVKKAKGKGSFLLTEEKLSVAVSEGMIGNLKVEKGDVEFVNIIEKGKGKADIHVTVNGPLKNGFEYLSLEPIALKHTFDLAKIKGDAKATVNINFPTHKNLKVEEVKVNASGVLSDVVLPGVMKKLTLTGGPLDFTVKGNEFRLKGEANIEGNAAKIEYAEFLHSEGQPYKSKVKAILAVDNKMRELLGMDLSDFLDGSVNVEADYTEFTNGKAEADVKADLAPARVFFKPLGYAKEPGETGSATLKAALEGGALKTVSGLNASAPGMEVKNAQFIFSGKESKLAGGEVANFVAGETVSKLKFDVKPSGQYVITIGGAFFDLRPSLGNEDAGAPYTAPPMQITLNAERIRAADGDATIQHGKIFVDIDGEGHFNALEMDGTAGAGTFYIRYKPDASGKQVFRMEGNDAGGTLRAFGIYDNIRGGKLDIYGEPIRGIKDRNVKGLAQIRDFKVVKAPTLARLLGMLSLPGAMSVLKEDGLSFKKLEAKFDWVYRPNGSLLVMKDGRTSGNSLGFTFDGTYDQVNGKVDVSGTMIPLSGLNKVIGNIPLIGDILTGGSGGVFAATYSVKGEAKSPQVFVNPLSVLTPGILRRILFEQN
ncbi:MAG: DUF3971 domain-containing protein [Alphaproteobacteria bacterium]